MKPEWQLIAAILGNLTCSTIGDICAKLWGLTNDHKWFYIGLPINIVTIATFMVIVRLGGLAITTTVVLVLTIVINVTLGYALFKERVDPIQWVGIIVGILTIPLILGVFSRQS
jgi:drug/metabolite transporter (DMT)-like permease